MLHDMKGRWEEFTKISKKALSKCYIFIRPHLINAKKIVSSTLKKSRELSQHRNAKSFSLPLLKSPHFPFAAVFLFFCLTCYSGWSLYNRIGTIKVLKEKVIAVETKLPLLAAIPQREKNLQTSLSKSDPLYLEHYLASMRLARLEAYSLETAKGKLSTPQATRLQFLMSPENTLHFLPGKSIKHAHKQVVEMKQDHPVEVDERDIQKILAHIEGGLIGPYAPAQHRPPMTIKKLTLKRKKDHDQNYPSYLLNLELWSWKTSQ